MSLPAPIPFQGSRLGQSWLGIRRSRSACWLSLRLRFESWLDCLLFYGIYLFIYSPDNKAETVVGPTLFIFVHSGITVQSKV